MKDRWTLLLGAAGLLGLAGLLATLATDAPRFWANWVLGFLYLLTLALGALFLVALEHLVNARWSTPLRRVSERLATLLLPAAPLALAALAGIQRLYPGSRPEALRHPILAGKAAWLSVPFVSLRLVLALGLFLLALWVLVRGSLRQDTTRDPAFTVRARRFAPAFMAIFGLGITLLAFDWISALEPEWYSDIFGVYLFAGAFLAALSATVLGLLHLQARGRLREVGPDHTYNLGGFLFAFTVFGSYIGFAQYLLMWYADLPEEVVWYQARLRGPWLGVALLLVLIHFLIPFAALLTRDAKSDPRRLKPVAALILFAHAVDLYWLIFPAIAPRPVLSWPELSALLFFGAAGLLWMRRAMGWGRDLPVGDPFLKQGLEFRL